LKTRAICPPRASLPAGSEPTQLKFLANQAIVLTDLENGGQRTIQVARDGSVEFEMPQPAGYRFVQYTHSAQE
jgi:hypothetical protein